MTVFEGKLVSENIKVGIVASRFNEFITSKLIGGAMDGLLRHNVREQDVDIAWVPGAFEAPLAAQKMAQSGRYDAVICLGALIVKIGRKDQPGRLIGNLLRNRRKNLGKLLLPSIVSFFPLYGNIAFLFLRTRLCYVLFRFLFLCKIDFRFCMVCAFLSHSP